MSPRTKSILLLLATLVIGLLLGAVINGYLVRQRLDRLGSLLTPDGFSGRLERVLEPVSDEQRAAIRSILESAAPRATEIMRRSREEMRMLGDSVKEELSDILTPEQMERFEEHMRFRRRGPWPGGPPGMDERRRPRHPGFRGRMRPDSGRAAFDSTLPPPPPPGP